MEPKTGRPSLTPLGAPRQPGLGRRPKWVASSTPRVAAANVWRRIHDYGMSLHNKEPAQNYSLFVDHRINRSGFRETIQWTSRDEVLLVDHIKRTWDAYFQAVGDRQQNPVGPQLVRPTIQLRSTAAPIAGLVERGTSDPTRSHGGTVAIDASSAASSFDGRKSTPLIATTLRELRALQDHGQDDTSIAPNSWGLSTA